MTTQWSWPGALYTVPMNNDSQAAPALPRDEERRGERHVMVDLETLDLYPGGALFAIGAVTFDVYAGTLGTPFFALVDPRDAAAHGLTTDAGTRDWWKGQAPAARRWLDQAGKTGLPLAEALDRFTAFLQSEAAPLAQMRLWGKGADFDNAFLAVAYRACGRPVPWGYRAGRCYRTLEALADTPPPAIKHGVVHHALDDCMGQAALAIPVLRRLYGLPALEQAIAFPAADGAWVQSAGGSGRMARRAP